MVQDDALIAKQCMNKPMRMSKGNSEKNVINQQSIANTPQSIANFLPNMNNTFKGANKEVQYL